MAYVSSGDALLPAAADLAPCVREGLQRAQRYLLELQSEDGHWCGELEGDTILESEYVLAMHYLGRTDDPKVTKAGNYIRGKQRDAGGWAIYPGGPAEVSGSVKAYFVLKLLGDDPDAPHMEKARRTILELGGVDACNSFTKIYLAIYGQFSWAKCPAVPPELILFPRWFYINVYEMSSWSRAILIPLSIIRALQPSCPVPDSAGISELFSTAYRPPAPSFWSALFLTLDAALKVADKIPVKPSRDIALKRAEQWILQRLEGSDGLAAIFPPIVNTIIALHARGYALDDPTIQQQVRELEKLEIVEDDTLRVQPCFSAVWDTALAVNALAESGLPSDDAALVRATRWLLDKRGHGSGDWTIKNGDGGAAGWYFEYANPFYPDCDTTAQTITALTKVDLPDAGDAVRCQKAIFEAHHWHLSMQNRDGGWGAFDKDCDKEILTHVPFADHNAMIDPSTSDLTARALEALSQLGYDHGYPPAARAVEFLRREQDSDGSWFGRWGCNYLYGTWLALWGLRAIGEEMSADPVVRGAQWLCSVQNDDGGWGELPQSYDDVACKGQGPSTASQTAWALLGLMAAGYRDSEAVSTGLRYLLDHQEPDGSWNEQLWTGTGFPGVFYLRYHLYSIYFPLLAFAEYANCSQRLLRKPTVATSRPARPRVGAHPA
jgi:squalene-hopene/tetraprenyl-beta-curcumene cyclase